MFLIYSNASQSYLDKNKYLSIKCIPFLLCSLFLTVAASFYDGHTIPADFFLPFLSQFFFVAQQKTAFLAHWLHIGLLPPMNLGLSSLFWQEKKKKKYNFLHFLIPRREKLDYQVCIRKDI